MTEDEPFIAGIRANPLDDLRRLVYADWLDERGRVEEAEYLRLVATLAATGTTVDPTHPNAVRLLALVERLDDPWREWVGSRFELWFGEIRADRMISFIESARAISGKGIAELKEFGARLPKVMSGLIPFEESVAQVDATAEDAARYYIVPSNEVRPGGLRRLNVSLILNARHRSPAENAATALGHMRRILERDPEFTHLAAGIPQTLEAVGDEVGYCSVVLANGLRSGEALLKAKQLGLRLCGDDRRIYGERTDPPFVGSLFVRVTEQPTRDADLIEPCPA
jgi:uncharacterized protein (TIGR02996 family)